MADLARVLVCGGRNIGRRVDGGQQWIVEVLDEISPKMVITGTAWSREHGLEGGLINRRLPIGADQIAVHWCRIRRVPCAVVEAYWKAWGNDRGEIDKTAGPKRNSAMLLLNPTLVIAFPGGRGTADMVAKARRAGVEVMEVKRQCLGVMMMIS